MSENTLLDKLSINYIEYNVFNIARSKIFFQQLVWTFINDGEAYCEFNSGTLKGGFSLSDEVKVEGGALIILYSLDLEHSLKLVSQSGGVIIKEIFSFPSGKRFNFQDLDGYELAICSHQSNTPYKKSKIIALNICFYYIIYI